MKVEINPFAGYGNVMIGNRLVGRDATLELLSSRLALGQGSFSIAGPPRIGKSSLAASALSTAQSRNPELTSFSLDLSTVQDSNCLFCTIIDELLPILRQRGTDVSVLESDVRCCADPYRSYRLLNRILRDLSRASPAGVAIVIDEFDHIRYFTDAGLTIQRLRELVNNRFATGLSAVFVSRRSLYSLEQQLIDVSTLDGVCEQHYVTPLDESGLELMIRRCEDKWAPSAEEARKLMEVTGGHPFLAEMILCHAWEAESFESGLQASLASIFNYYENLRSLMEGDKSFSALIQITVGPRYRVTTGDIERLTRYGLISSNGKSFTGWSEHFQTYLEKCSREIPIWEVWKETECLLRECIYEVMERELGVDWQNKVATRHKAIAEMLENCRQRMNKEAASFGRSSGAILDYTYPMELYDLIAAEWSSFRDKFGKDKKYWSERFNTISKVRNPTAHNRETVVPEHTLTVAQGYCQEIVQLLKPNRTPDPTNSRLGA